MIFSPLLLKFLASPRISKEDLDMKLLWKTVEICGDSSINFSFTPANSHFSVSYQWKFQPIRTNAWEMKLVWDVEYVCKHANFFTVKSFADNQCPLKVYRGSVKITEFWNSDKKFPILVFFSNPWLAMLGQCLQFLLQIDFGWDTRYVR